ncbi:MAG: DUF2384 domain-containing protein, partial [Algiphilus sp.]|uniref:antitoxin Xre/MbcA/ParS toxin-binding domain-containing protein n=1 Tax=Algiphilus sp. TaxID=1872431 RepID=UPI0032EEC26C
PTSCRDRTLISTACSKLNMGGQKAAILAQVGQIYFGAVGQFYIGANKQIQDGLPFTAFERINTLVFAGQQDLARLVISPATRKRRRKDKKGLSAKSSQQLERIARVWIMAIDIYKDELMARRYLTEPHMMLRGKRPVALASTNDGGARAVQDMLGRLKYSVAL